MFNFFNKLDKRFLSPYSHKQEESKIYKKWEKSGYFNPDKLNGNDKFSILMPPPNSNGELHAGHALFIALQDAMIRFNRMKGKKALWVPGFDHAGIETQIMYDKKLKDEGKNSFDIDKKTLYKNILKFTLDNKEKIKTQLKTLGASCDWSREYFTLDENVKTSVYETFDKMYKDGYLYRGYRPVNWCPGHKTSFSNIEVEYKTRKDKFYYLKYGPFIIGTARPETKFADKYIVVHPDDPRYSQYKNGEEFEVEWINGKIKATLIKDEAGNPDMGSGAMTITPFHSQIDFEIAQRHNLNYEQIIDEDGKLLPVAGEFEGMYIKKARDLIIEKLEKKGLVEKIDENYEHSVPVCYKCSREIEPQLKEQWFVKVKPLVEKTIGKIKTGEVSFVTKQHEAIAIKWMENLQDWNISRQIVWGIPIPAKICGDCKNAVVDLKNKVNKCNKCNGKMVQDTDTFDTWFSSSQLPYIVFDKEYYPTTVMETGYDILFQWVSRMLFMGVYNTGEVPFSNIYLHGLVRDHKGQKMSKSKGNGVNPIEIVEEYGSDALRMSLLVGNVPGQDANFSIDKVKAYKKFANKLWNISRFVLNEVKDFNEKELNERDQKVKVEFDIIAKDITKDIEEFRFHLASEKIYHYVWHTFADVVIEESKDKMDESRKYLLAYIFTNSLKLLHPFMPFVTESIWRSVPNRKRMLMIEEWPVRL